MLVHAVHAGAEGNVCNTVVSTETHQTPTNFAETMCKNRNSEDPNQHHLIRIYMISILHVNLQ